MVGKSKLVVLFFSALIVVYGLAGGLLERVSAGDDPYGSLSIFTEVVQKLRSDYVDEPNMPDAFNGALQGLMEALDPFSSFVDHRTFVDLEEQSGQAGSVGVVLSKRYGYAYVVSVIPGSPAAREGIRTGDLIESVEEKSTMKMSLWEVEARLKGPESSKVSLRVVRARRTEPADIELVRENVQLPTVTARLAEPEIGLIQIPDFAPGTVEEVGRRARMLAASGMKGLLIDIRGNARGELEEATRAADLFLPEGKTILEVGTRDGGKTVYWSKTAQQVAVDPLVLLVDGGTSGFAEVFAAALRDNLQATVLGEKTNGYGSVQKEFSLSDGSVLFLTTDLFVRANGEYIQAVTVRESGLSPEIRSPAQDFVTNFYYENTTEDLEESLNEEFYRKLDEAIEKEQLDSALEEVRKRTLKKAA